MNEAALPLAFPVTFPVKLPTNDEVAVIVAALTPVLVMLAFCTPLMPNRITLAALLLRNITSPTEDPVRKSPADAQTPHSASAAVRPIVEDTAFPLPPESKAIPPAPNPPVFTDRLVAVIAAPVNGPMKEVAVIAPAANSPVAPLVTMALFVFVVTAVVMALVIAPFAIVVAL